MSDCNFDRSRRGAGRLRGRGAAPRASHAVVVMILLSALLLAATAVADERLSDPMRPPGIVEVLQPALPTATRSLVLQSILIAEDRRVAMINDQRLQEGDEIEGARVVSIAPNHVRITRSGEELKLRLVSRNVKRVRGSPEPDDAWTSAPAAPASTPTEKGKAQ